MAQCRVLLFSTIIVTIIYSHAFPHNSVFLKRNLQKRKVSTSDDGLFFPPGMSDFSADGKGVDCIDTVCANATDYPYDHVYTLMKNITDLHNLFGHFDGSYINKDSRIGEDDVPLEPLCESTLYTKYPLVLANQNKVNKYIINVGDYKQGLIFETCVTGAHCRKASFPQAYESECVQKYSTKRLLSVETKSGEASFDSFVYPSSCVCAVRNTVKRNL